MEENGNKGIGSLPIIILLISALLSAACAILGAAGIFSNHPVYNDPELSVSLVRGNILDRNGNYGRLFEDRTMPSRQVIILQGKYILTAVKSGLLVINIRRARERILYERFLKAIQANSHVTQTALFPVSVYVGVENMPLFDEYSGLLASIGFDISPFGKDTIVVNGVPEGYSVEEGKVRTVGFDKYPVLRGFASDFLNILS